MATTPRDRTRNLLDSMQADGIVTDYYVYNPDGKKKRWVIWGPGMPQAVYTTREVEVMTETYVATRRELT